MIQNDNSFLDGVTTFGSAPRWTHRRAALPCLRISSVSPGSSLVKKCIIALCCQHYFNGALCVFLSFSFLSEIVGVGCVLNGVRYNNGDTFQPNCKYNCTCINGAVGCIPMCTNSRPPLVWCPNPKLIKMAGKCCEQWICDDSKKIRKTSPRHISSAGMVGARWTSPLSSGNWNQQLQPKYQLVLPDLAGIWSLCERSTETLIQQIVKDRSCKLQWCARTQQHYEIHQTCSCDKAPSEAHICWHFVDVTSPYYFTFYFSVWALWKTE